jgi:hypothetical protein
MLTTRELGWSNIVFGMFSLIRLTAEPHFRVQVVLFDASVATLWLLSGKCLLSSDPAWMITAMAAGASAARSMISGTVVGMRMADSLWNIRDTAMVPQAVADSAARFLSYGVEFLYWPFVVLVMLKAFDAPRPRGQPDPGNSSCLAFAGAAVLGMIVQAALLGPLR